MLRRFSLSCPVLHADETPLRLLDPGAGKTKKAYVWAWARIHQRLCQLCVLGAGGGDARSQLATKGVEFIDPLDNAALLS